MDEEDWENLENRRLGEPGESLVCFDAEQNQAVTVAMINQTERRLDIFTGEFEPLIYDNEECFEAFESLALRSHHSRIRILIRDPYTVSRRRHRILRLAMRLDSRFELLRAAPVHLGRSDSFLVADGIGIIHRPYSDSLKAEAGFCDPLGARELSGAFQAMWEQGEPDPNLRSVFL